jgi:hypothetical protein
MRVIADYLGLRDAALSECPLQITGMRILTESLAEYSPELVYIGNASEIFYDENLSKNCVLLNEKNMIIVSNKSVGEISNELFSCFEYFSRWEQSLEKAMKEKNVLQAFVNASEKVFGGSMSIIDQDAAVLAHSRIDDNSPAWHKELAKTKRLPLDVINNSAVTFDGKIVASWSETPTIYIKENHFRRIGVHINVPNSSMLSLCIEENKKIFTYGFCQLAEILCRFIKRTAMEREYKPLGSFDIFFTDLLDGEYHNKKNTFAVSLPQVEMGFTIPWTLMVIHGVSIQSGVIRQKRLLNEIKTIPIIKRSILFKNDIIITVSRNSLEQMLHEIPRYIKPQYYSIGISMPFSKIEDAYSRYHQCMAAVSAGKKPVTYAEEIAFSYLLAETKKANAAHLFCHPALEILHEKDTTAELYETLRQYLFHERNNTETAKALKIHRNTLSYRLLQIEELTALHLDDAEERHFALFSFLLEREEYPPPPLPHQIS